MSSPLSLNDFEVSGYRCHYHTYDHHRQCSDLISLAFVFNVRPFVLSSTSPPHWSTIWACPLSVFRGPLTYPVLTDMLRCFVSPSSRLPLSTHLPLLLLTSCCDMWPLVDLFTLSTHLRRRHLGLFFLLSFS